VPSAPLAPLVETVRQLIDRALGDALPRPPECPALISEAMRYSVFAGGKRLRPLITLASADAVHRRRDSHAAPPDGLGPDAIAVATPAACAIELLHTYSLIHDDLPAMDNDTLRRGRPTLHVVYGDGIAILAGDGLQAEAFSLLARAPQSGADPTLAARQLRTSGVIAAAAGSGGMVGGQVIDLQAAGQVPGHGLTLDGDGLRAMHERKTGALIRAAAVSGGIMAGADEGAVQALDGWAAQIGLAFQIVDDILDVEGEASALGKTAGKDAACAKPTYPALFGLAASRALAATCIERAHALLADAQLTDGWLDAIGQWAIDRRS
jgi:geranylgeranyl pyrophosphate synthase